MKRYLHAFAMTQSMFCSFPAPWKIWDEQARPLMLLFLPLVGLEIGLVWAALAWLCRYFALNSLVTGLILCAVPYFASGCIHLDGFLDVTDAVHSWRDQEQRRKILKDSHVGAFAVIYCVFVLLSGFALLAAAPAEASIGILVWIPVVSRCCSALAITALRPMSTSQYAGAFRQDIPRTHPWILMAVGLAALTLGFYFCGWYGFALIAVPVGYAFALARAFRSLGGMNGDIAGYALTIAELCGCAVFALI
ncbi:MAG: adenosylcobinamide-GDP ribazoletransferase [Firmicutes bacterium]|nr:adenosylcobinamide-GDP ribazoletransferase [Bacillota bacterium]